MFKTANEYGTTTESYLKSIVPEWKDFCTKYRVSFDNFYRTSTDDHHKGAKQIWNACFNKGDIYKKHYEGLYCIGCESFIHERDLIDGKCPNHDSKPILYSEENYFFRLSNYSNQILEFLNSNPSFLKPKSKIQELKNFVENLEDISVSRSRTNLPWGVPVPNDPKQTIYVWFDALTNYIRVIGFDKDMESFYSWWPGVQICGPDNLRFQGAIWQGMLASLDLPFTKKLLVHGTILGADGNKMSKSLGNVISPLQQFEKYGSDICRFYMLGVLRTYSDSNYREDELTEAYNAHLANGYGNLLNRLIHLGNVKDTDLFDESLVDENFRHSVNIKKKRIQQKYEDFELHDASKKIRELVAEGNQHMNKNQPWNQPPENAKMTLANVSYLFRTATELYEPIIPDGATRALEAMKNKARIILYPKI